jgi:BON domain
MPDRNMLVLLVTASALIFGGCNAAHMGKKAQADDTSITNAIEAGLFQDSTLKTRDVRVVSQNGVVTLTGSVNSGVEKLAVEHIANQASGVSQVIDQLTVTPAAVVQNTPVPTPAAPRETTTPPAHHRHVRRVQQSEQIAEARPMNRTQRQGFQRL